MFKKIFFNPLLFALIATQTIIQWQRMKKKGVTVLEFRHESMNWSEESILAISPSFLVPVEELILPERGVLEIEAFMKGEFAEIEFFEKFSMTEGERARRKRRNSFLLAADEEKFEIFLVVDRNLEWRVVDGSHRLAIARVRGLEVVRAKIVVPLSRNFLYC